MRGILAEAQANCLLCEGNEDTRVPGQVGSPGFLQEGDRVHWGDSLQVYLASLDPKAKAQPWPGLQEGTQRALAPRTPRAGGPGTKPWGRGHSSRTWSKVLVTAEAGPSPLHLPSSLHTPVGVSLRQALVLSTSWVQCQAPVGQVSQGDLQVTGVCRGV